MAKKTIKSTRLLSLVSSCLETDETIILGYEILYDRHRPGVCTAFEKKNPIGAALTKAPHLTTKCNGQAPPSKTHHRPDTCGSRRIVLNTQLEILKELDANAFARTNSDVEVGCLPTLRLAASHQARSAR